MSTKDVFDLVDTMREQAIRNAVDTAIPENTYPAQWDLEGLKLKLIELIGMNFPLVEWGGEDNILEDDIYERIWKSFGEFEEKRRENFDEGVFEHALKHVLLESFDAHWRDHLISLEMLKDVVNFRSYAQRDPVVEYRTEAFHMFESLLNDLSEDVTIKSSRIISTKPRISEEIT